MRAWMTRLALVYCASASVRAADLYPPAAPDEAGSAMVSGQAILNRLQTGTNAPLRSGAFTEPVAGPTAGTMPTLNEIMAAAPATNAAAAAPGEVLAGKAYWGLVESAWGTQTGTMTNQAALGFMPGPANVTIPAGYYSGSGVVTGDVDLVTANIRAGVNLFGVTGTPAVVNTASGTATAGNMLTGNTAYVNGSLVTGTMATRTLSAANATVSAGYYAATTLTNVDPDLAATNIRVSTVIFGQTGTLRPALGDATAAQVLSGRTFTTNDSAQLTGTMTNYAARGFMPGPANVSIPAGYYSGSGVVTGDVDLVTANIRAGVNLFGVTGTPAVVNTASGTATAGNMLTGNTAYVNGSLVTGTMATRTLSAANATVSAGYYAATTLTAVDPDLAATNIQSGTVIFGQTGTLRPALGDATAAQVLSGRTFTTNNSAQLTGTMPSNALSAANATVSAGYYAATTLTNVDADLKATNVAQGVTIFGVTGSVYRTTVPKTGQTTSYQSGDDGAYEKGEAWPSSRFTVQANTNCVLDNLTGLTWARNANLYGGTRTWTEAHTYCEGLSYGGQTDWRLPNVREFLSLIDYGRPAPSLPSGHPFANVQLEAYWTSSTIADDTLYAWAMVLQGYSGRSTYGDKEYPLFLWPVRGGQ
jgi:hypothetical protein